MALSAVGEVSCDESTCCGAAEANPTRNHEVAGSIPGLFSELRIWRCRELWWRLQTWLGSAVAVAVVQAGSCSAAWTPSLGTSICCGYGPKKTNKQNKTKKHSLLRWVDRASLSQSALRAVVTVSTSVPSLPHEILPEAPWFRGNSSENLQLENGSFFSFAF